MKNLVLKGLPIRSLKYLIFCVMCLLAEYLPVKAQFPEVLIPDEVIVQHAGSIGYFSAGAGYRLFKNRRGNLDLDFGYVPQNKGGSLFIVSPKFAYRAVEVRLKKNIKFYPLNPGLFASYTFGKDLSFWWDKKQYPKGYYWWSEALRLHVSLSSEISIASGKFLEKCGIKSLSFYSELNTNELYLLSYLENDSGLSLTDIVKLGLGLRLAF